MIHRNLLCIIVVLSLATHLSAQLGPNESTLTLVTEAGFNEFNINVSVPLLGSDDDTTTLSGTLQSLTNILASTGQSAQVTLSDGEIAATPTSFSIGNFFLGYLNLNSTALGATLATIAPPGTMNPTTGQTDASQFSFTIDEGSFTGTAPGTTDPINLDLTAAPVTGTGSGNGTVTISPDGTTQTRANYTLTVTMPISITQMVPTGVMLGESELIATVTVTGTIKATGTVYVHLSAYLKWTEENSQPGSDFNTTALGHIPNGLLWALGYDASNVPNQIIVPGIGTFSIPLPATGTLHPSVIQCSTNLVDWDPIDISKVSTASNTIPIGSTGTITITPSGLSSYYRIHTTE